MMSEIAKWQELFQHAKGYVHMKNGGIDRFTSVYIPLAMTAAGLAFVSYGYVNMCRGVGKKE